MIAVSRVNESQFTCLDLSNSLSQNGEVIEVDSAVIYTFYSKLLLECSNNDYRYLERCEVCDVVLIH